MTAVIDLGAQTREWAAFADHNGHAEMEASTIVELWLDASNDDDGTTVHGGRVFYRDDLAAVVSALVDLFPCGNRHHHGTNLPGLSPDGWCRNCESAAAAMTSEDRS